MIAGRDEDLAFFRKAMSGVDPLHERSRDAKALHRGASSGPAPKQRPARSVAPPAPQSAAIPDGPPIHGPVLHVRPGLQRQVVRKLKRGGFAVEGSLDLHGLDKTGAGKALERFLHDCVLDGCRCVLVIHGKGNRSAGGHGVLKPYTVNWLKQHASVLGFCSTQPRDGGTGSVYVLLRSPARSWR